MRLASKLNLAAVCAALMLGAVPALAQNDGVQVGGNSGFTRLVPAEEIEQAARQQYSKMMQEAAAQNALAPPNN
ncbi:MAG: M48 family peptidase, partial [Polaromonas sp.]|nr:M48 family peptidase [Polaromonas sp.]